MHDHLPKWNSSCLLENHLWLLEVSYSKQLVTLLFELGAKVSIIDTTFARKVGCVIDEIITKNMWVLERIHSVRSPHEGEDHVKRAHSLLLRCMGR